MDLYHAAILVILLTFSTAASSEDQICGGYHVIPYTHDPYPGREDYIKLFLNVCSMGLSEQECEVSHWNSTYKAICNSHLESATVRLLRDMSWGHNLWDVAGPCTKDGVTFRYEEMLGLCDCLKHLAQVSTVELMWFNLIRLDLLY